jgi:sugar phosphate isomerase/epimerase
VTGRVVKPKVAIGTWAFIRGGHAAGPVPLATVLRQVGAHGFDGVELAGFAPHLHPRAFPTSASRREVKRWLEGAGLQALCLAADFAEVPPALVEPARYFDVVEANLEICHELGIPMLRVDTMSPSGAMPGGLDRETCFWRIAEAWHGAAQTCAEAGVRLVWEFEAAFLFNQPSDVMRMLYAVDHPGFMVLFDTFHAFNCGVLGARQVGEPETLPGGIPQFAHMLTGKIGLAHLSGYEQAPAVDGVATGRRTLDCPPDLDAAMAAIGEAGYSGEWWTIDLGGFWPDAMADTGRAREFADSLVRRSREGKGRE